MNNTPNKNRYWLKQHQITAFWHGFGISNGKEIPKEMTSEIYTDGNGSYIDTPVKNGKTYIKVKPEYFQELLKDYIKWLEKYQLSWNHEDKDTDTDTDTGVDNRADFIKDESVHESRADILKMVELLQECRIEDK